MKSVLASSRDLLFACFVTGFLVLACQLGQETRVENSLSFSKHFDSLSRYDSLVIEVKDPDGKSLGILFHAKPASADQLDHLLVPDWDGGPIDIFITGYMDGHAGPVYQVKKRYDAKNGTTATVLVIDPNPTATVPTKLTLFPDTLRLAAHGAPGRFAVTLEPTGADQALLWSLSDSTLVAQRSDGAFIGLERGTTKVLASCKLKPEVTFTAWIAVSEPVPVASVRFVRDSLSLFLGGAPESLQVEVLPAPANSEVAFSLSDSTKATLAGRLLTPKAIGTFTVQVRSVEDPAKTDLLPVTVREPVRIDAVTANDTAVILYLGGPGLTLTGKVLPESAPQDLRWKSLSPSLVSVDPRTGALSAVQAGIAEIAAASAVDSSKRATVKVTVKIDAPRLAITADSVVSAGGSVGFHVNAAQEFGQLTLFQWDLDGNGAWDDSTTGPWTGASVDLPVVTAKYDKAGTVVARFRVRDGEGNAAAGTHTLRVVGTSAVSIESPKNNAYTNQKRIQVEWSVNGIAQDSLKSQDLVAGPNVITRSARDSAGKVSTASVTVTLDTVPPVKPVISGSSPTNVKPQWTWSTGGGGGSGEYRFRLGDAAFPADAPTARDTTYTLASAPVSGTTYALYVEERDLAGNWSAAASLPIRFDVTAPVVAITAPQTSGTYFTSAASVTLTGTASGPAAISQVDYKVGGGASAKAVLTGGTWSTAAIPLTEGSNAVVTVTATDQAGNTSVATLTVLMDATVPAAPAITAAPAAEISAIKGDFAWTAGTDGAAGSGLNGHFRYAINGGAWKDTTAALLTNLPLSEGTNVFAVQEQDRALLWSASATKSVRVDLTGPVITLTSPANTSNYASLTITLSGQVKDSGTAVTGMTVSGQQAGSGAVTIASGIWTSAALTLKSGGNALSVVATDRVGNATTLPVTVNVSLPAPVVVITNPTDSLTITPADNITVTYTVDGGAAQTKAFALTEGVNRLVVSNTSSASGKTGSDTVKVTKDATAPNAPTVTRGTTPTKTAASWTWTSNGDNTGGAGVRSPAVYRYSLDAGATWTQLGTASFQVTAEGSWTLVVQEQDKAGNWSASSAAQTIVVDKTPPSVVITTPANNYVTSLGSVNIGYKVDNVAQTPIACALNTLNGANTCTASSTDAAGNLGSASITVYRRANVYFVSLGGAGNKSGVNWENAMDSTGLQTAMASSAFAGKEFWVGSGIYTTRLQASYSMTLYGGFDVASKPFDTSVRNLVGTRVTAYFQASPEIGLTSMNVTVDGFVLTAVGASGLGNTVNFTNITLDDNSESSSYGMYLIDDVSVVATNLNVKNQSYGTNVIFSGGSFKMVGGAITGNNTQYGTAIRIYGTASITNGAVVSGNFSQENPAYQAEVAGQSTLTIGSGVNLSCSSVLVASGGSCQ